MEFCAKTDRGRKRQMNQDCVFGCSEQLGTLPNLYLLADGMGGHQAGDYASRYLVDELQKHLAIAAGAPVVRLLDQEIQVLSRELYEKAESHAELSGMGTTLVVCVIEGSTAVIGNVGDSRAYLVHRNHIQQITKDHSYVEEMVERGYMSRGSRDYLASRNIITRAVGIEPNVEVDFFEVDLEEGDLILLCSDGLTNMVDDGSIFHIVRDEASLSDKVETLIDVANINGGKDNIAVILIDPNGTEVKV